MNPRIFLGLLIVFHAFLLSGSRTSAIAPYGLILLLGVFLLGALQFKERKLNLEYLKETDRLLRKFYCWPVVVALICLHMTVGVLGLVLNYLGLDGTLWDLTMYIQQAHNMALTGTPTATFSGEILNHHNTHRSLALYLVAALYRLTGSPLVVPFYQGLMLYLPGLIFGYGFYKVVSTQKNKTQPIPSYTVLFAFYAFSMNAAVMNQGTWPYVYYMLGPSLLALAYYFYAQGWFWTWLLVAALLPFEKEDFGFLTAGFAAVALYDEFKKSKKSWGKLISAFLLIPLGFGSLILFHKYNATVVTFESRYYELGKTPIDVVLTVLTHPKLVASILIRPENLSLALFVFAVSFVPLAFKKSFKYLVPVSLVFIANLLSSYSAMKTLKDPYILPLATGAIATLVFAVAPQLVRTWNRSLAFILFIIFSFTSLLWSHQTSYRTLKENYSLYTSQKNSRLALEPLKIDRHQVVCCEDRTCAYLADRPSVIEANRCLNGTSLLLPTDVVTYVTYANTTLNLTHVEWAYSSENIKISKPVTLATSRGL